MLCLWIILFSGVRAGSCPLILELGAPRPISGLTRFDRWRPWRPYIVDKLSKTVTFVCFFSGGGFCFFLGGRQTFSVLDHTLSRRRNLWEQIIFFGRRIFSWKKNSCVWNFKSCSTLVTVMLMYSAIMWPTYSTLSLYYVSDILYTLSIMWLAYSTFSLYLEM